MANRYFASKEAEDAFFDKAEAQRASRERYASQNNEAIAKRLESMGVRAPWIRPDAALSLADAGMDANDPNFDKVAKAAGKKKSWWQPGDWVNAAKTAVGMSTAMLPLGSADYLTKSNAAKAAGSALSGAGAFAGAIAKPAIRTSDIALQAPLQEVQGQFRNAVSGNWGEVGKSAGALVASTPIVAATIGDKIGEETLGKVVDLRPDAWKRGLNSAQNAVLGQSQSTAGVALQQLANDQNVETGKGFFAQGSTRLAQIERSRAAGSIKYKDGNFAITPGRWLANQTRVLDPGTQPFNLLSGLVDTAVAIGADPASAALSGVGKARQASKLFVNPNEKIAHVDELKEGAGAIAGHRKDIIPQRVEAWINSDSGSKVVQFAADNDYKTLKKTLGKGIEERTLVALADAKSPDEVVDILKPRLGIDNGLRTKPELPGAVSSTVKNLTEPMFKNSRISKMMPGNRIDLNDHDDAVNQIDLFASNAKLPEDLRWARTEQMARAQSKPEMLKATEDLMTDVAAHLSDGKVDTATARKLTTLWKDKNGEETRYWINALDGDNMPVPGAALGLDGKVTPTPHRYNEMINSAIPLPDAREIRSATSKWGRLLSNAEINRTLPNGKVIKAKLPVDQSRELGDYVVQLWKGSVLIRAAYTLRVEGESQLRMAGAGYNTLFKHPLDYLGFVSKRKGRVGVGGQDIVDESKLASEGDEYAASLSKNYDYQPWGGKAAGHKVETFNKDISDPEDFVDAWADTIMKARADEPTRRVVGDWSDAKVPKHAMAGNNVEATKLWFKQGDGVKIREEMASAPGRKAIKDDAIADEYIDSLMTRVDMETNANPELIQAIATGMFRGKPIREGFKVNDDFRSYLRQQVDEGNAPQKVRGQKMAKYEKGKFHPMEHLDRAIDAGFNLFASMPANKFSRSPMFMQANWNRATELMPFASKDAQARIIFAAEKSKLPKPVLEKLHNARSQGFGELDQEEVDQLAKLYALGEVKERLYDLSRRSQFFDAYRLIFPFGDAWLEVANSWRKIVTENPATIRRGQQTITGARGADPDGDGQGFFYKDPTTGQEMYTMPWSKHWNQAWTGLPIQNSSPVKGLNIFGTIVPGFGPAVQIPAGAWVPDTEEWDEVRSLLMPMGKQDSSGGAVAESFLPAWAKKLYTGFKPEFNEKQFNDSVNNIASMLFDQGRYNPNDPDSAEEAFAEARRLAPRLWYARGLAQFAAPSPPSPEFMMHDETGKLVMMDYLINDLRAMQQADETKGYGGLEYKDVSQTFLKKYGLDALLVLEGKTTNVKGNLPVTKQAKNWARSNTELREKYGDVYGFFAPQEGKFDIDAYSRQLSSGDRVGKSPDEVKAAVEAEIGNMIWRNVQDEVGDRNDTKAKQWKQRQRQAIEQQYPGFGDQKINLRDTANDINKLTKALENDKLANTPTGRNLQIYFDLRDQALKRAEAKGMDPTQISSTPKAKNLRANLFTAGEGLAAQSPDFRVVWERVLKREVEEQEEN